MADKTVKNTIVMTDENLTQNLGDYKLTFPKPDGTIKTMTVTEYLKMMVDLAQCGIPSNLILTFTTKN